MEITLRTADDDTVVVGDERDLHLMRGVFAHLVVQNLIEANPGLAREAAKISPYSRVYDLGFLDELDLRGIRTGCYAVRLESFKPGTEEYDRLEDLLPDLRLAGLYKFCRDTRPWGIFSRGDVADIAECFATAKRNLVSNMRRLGDRENHDNWFGSVSDFFLRAAARGEILIEGY